MPTVKCPKCEFANEAGRDSCVRCMTPLPQVQLHKHRLAAKAPPKSKRHAELVQLRSGQVVAERYTVLDLIGRGGMGCIYKVYDNTLKEELALKTLQPQFLDDKTVIARFYNEARIARSMSHPNIVRVHDIGTVGKILYISMEYVEGNSLREVMDRLPAGQRLPIKTTLKVIDELCGALSYAHEYTIHRDIKPDNIMCGANMAIKLMDFGISKLTSRSNLTATSVVMGTPHYMAPEQIRNSKAVDLRADIYSVGVVLYELVTGNIPSGIPKPASQIISDVPPTLDPIIEKCVDHNPRNRFQSAAELRKALAPIIKLMETEDEPGAGHDSMQKTGGATKARFVGACLMALIMALSAAGLFQVERQRRAAVAAVAGQTIPGELDGADGPFNILADKVRQAEERADSRMNFLIEGGEQGGAFAMAMKARMSQVKALWGRARGEVQSVPERALADANSAFLLFLAIADCPKEMVIVPPGEVTIGVRTEFVDGFYVDATEVTNLQYLQFCDDGDVWRLPSYVRKGVPLNEAYLNLPVTGVTYYDAQAYAASHGKLLPTRYQWSRAAGAPQEFPWGSEWDPKKCNSASRNDGFPGTAPVRSFESDCSIYGCYDMAGNVAEWTRSKYTGPVESDESELPYFGDQLLVQGGWYAATAPVTFQNPLTLPFRAARPDVGFRCVKALPTSLDDLGNADR